MVPPVELTQVPRTVMAMDASPALYRVFEGKSPTVTRAATRATLWASLSLLFEKQGVNAGYNPLSLALQRNETFIREMSPAMMNLIGIRYYLLSLEPMPPTSLTPLDDSQPAGGMTIDILAQEPSIPPTHVSQIILTSYTDRSGGLSDGQQVGELVLGSMDGKQLAIPIRVGIETADWAYDALVRGGQVNHAKPAESLDFQAFLNSLGGDFIGHKYVVKLNVPGQTITSIGAHSLLSDTRLTFEKIVLVDDAGRSVSLAALLHRNEMALAFRSQNATMWENQSAMPRAFVVHRAEIENDEQMLARLQDPNFRPEQVVLLSDGESSDQADGLGLGKDEVAINSYEPERVSVQAKTDQPGYLVLTDSWYPGWIASVDGQPSPIYRADYIFRAVALPPGQHAVVFEYRPMTFLWGALITLSSLVLAGILAIAG